MNRMNLFRSVVNSIVLVHVHVGMPWDMQFVQEMTNDKKTAAKILRGIHTG